jgi:histidine ammonia-lyase
MRGLLQQSGLFDDDPSRSVQDALSFRVVPQVHGALWEFVELARKSVEAELNAMTDNPLVSREERRMISNGNFHPMALGLSFDALRPALAHAGQLSERRMNHLWATTFAKPAVSTSDANRSVWGSAGDRRGVSLGYSAAAASGELRQLAGPATLDIAPLDLGIEDHASGAPLSVRRTEAALERLDDILAVELLIARDLLMSGAPARRLGLGSAAVLETVNSALKGLGPEVSSGDFHATVRSLGAKMLIAAGEAAGRLGWSD